MISTLALSPAVDKIYFVEDFEVGGLYRTKRVLKSAGGKGINVARVATLLGEKVVIAGFTAGENGEWLKARLKELSIDMRFVTVNGESRTNNNIIDMKNKSETEILEVGPLISQENIKEFMELYCKVLDSTHLLVCSGGLPEGIPSDFYKKLIEDAVDRKIKVILDSNGDMLREGIKAKPFMIKPNLRELSNLVKSNLKDITEIIDACKYINTLGVQYVAASMGAEGALLVSDECILLARTPEIEAVNTIGCGDSMVAGFAAGLTRGYSNIDVFRLGMACAAANTQFQEIGFITPGLVEKYLEKIMVETIK